MRLTIEAARNGYIVSIEQGALRRETEVYATLEEVFERALAAFEHKSCQFTGQSWAKVAILRGEPKDLEEAE